MKDAISFIISYGLAVVGYWCAWKIFERDCKDEARGAEDKNEKCAHS